MEHESLTFVKPICEEYLASIAEQRQAACDAEGIVDEPRGLGTFMRGKQGGDNIVELQRATSRVRAGMDSLAHRHSIECAQQLVGCTFRKLHYQQPLLDHRLQAVE